MIRHSTSREQILSAVKKNKPQEPAPLPVIPAFETPKTHEEAVQIFIETLRKVGAEVAVVSSREQLSEIIGSRYPQAKNICSLYESVSSNVSPAEIRHPAELAEVDVAIVEGLLGVAENGAIWLTEEQTGHRVVPFITQHLVIVLSEKNIVGNMHAAYQKIGVIQSGFGTFISGPSRTADIEQSLVIGAHGARSLLVCLLSQ